MMMMLVMMVRIIIMCTFLAMCGHNFRGSSSTGLCYSVYVITAYYEPNQKGESSQHLNIVNGGL